MPDVRSGKISPFLVSITGMGKRSWSENRKLPFVFGITWLFPHPSAGSSHTASPVSFLEHRIRVKDMSTQGQITLSLLHDLALLYLSLAHGTDDDLAPSESRAMAINLRRWQPDKDPALIDHVIREATLSYLNRANTTRIEDAVQTLKEALPEETRSEILNDMVELARADGKVLAAEGGFIRKVAEAWGIDLEQQPTSLP